LTREGPLDALAVHVEAADTAAFAACAGASKALVEQIKSMIGISARVEVREPGSIERSIGKAKRVIDKRTPRAG
jgi:phenylacetate-CoA ligase